VEIITGCIVMQLARPEVKPFDGRYLKYMPTANKSIKKYEEMQKKTVERCRKTVKRIRQTKLYIRESLVKIRENNTIQMTYKYLTRAIEQPKDLMLAIKNRTLSEDTNSSMEIQEEST
jgi:hypothetical protein